MHKNMGGILSTPFATMWGPQFALVCPAPAAGWGRNGYSGAIAAALLVLPFRLPPPFISLPSPSPLLELISISLDAHLPFLLLSKNGGRDDDVLVAAFLPR